MKQREEFESDLSSRPVAEVNSGPWHGTSNYPGGVGLLPKIPEWFELKRILKLIHLPQTGAPSSRPGSSKLCSEENEVVARIGAGISPY